MRGLDGVFSSGNWIVTLRRNRYRPDSGGRYRPDAHCFPSSGLRLGQPEPGAAVPHRGHQLDHSSRGHHRLGSPVERATPHQRQHPWRDRPPVGVDPRSAALLRRRGRSGGEPGRQLVDDAAAPGRALAARRSPLGIPSLDARILWLGALSRRPGRGARRPWHGPFAGLRRHGHPVPRSSERLDDGSARRRSRHRLWRLALSDSPLLSPVIQLSPFAPGPHP